MQGKLYIHQLLQFFGGIFVVYQIYLSNLIKICSESTKNLLAQWHSLVSFIGRTKVQIPHSPTCYNNLLKSIMNHICLNINICRELSKWYILHLWFERNMNWSTKLLSQFLGLLRLKFTFRVCQLVKLNPLLILTTKSLILCYIRCTVIWYMDGE